MTSKLECQQALPMYCKSCATNKDGCYYDTEIGSVCVDCYMENQAILQMGISKECWKKVR